MSVYSALARRQHLARRVDPINRLEELDGFATDDRQSSWLEAELKDLTSQVVAVRDDFVQFPITSFFRTADPHSSLALALPVLFGLRQTVGHHLDPGTRLQGMMLSEAFEALAHYVAGTWLA